MRERTSGCKHLGTGRYGGHFVHTLSASAQDQENILSSLWAAAQGENFTIFPWDTAVPVPRTHIRARLHSVRASSALHNLCELEKDYLISPSFRSSSVKNIVG